jgi:drug/metabolite transporter (DMT)-like permease
MKANFITPARSSSRSELIYLYAKLVISSLFWGGNFIAGRIVAHQLPAMTAAAIRFLIAGVLLTGWMAMRGEPIRRPTLRQLVSTAVLGLFGVFLYNVCFFGALVRIPAGRASLFMALNPLMTAALAAIILREKLTRTKWVAFGISLVGTVVIITKGNPFSEFGGLTRVAGFGDALMLCAPLCWAVYTLVGRRTLSGMTPLSATAYAVLWGALFLVVGSWLQHADVDWTLQKASTWTAVAYLALCGTALSFVWWYDAVAVLGSSRTAVFNNLIPVFAVALSSVLLSEPIEPSAVLGGSLVIIGVLLVNR